MMSHHSNYALRSLSLSLSFPKRDLTVLFYISHKNNSYKKCSANLQAHDIPSSVYAIFETM